MLDNYLSKELASRYSKSLLAAYDTVIVDLDDTIWNCFGLLGERIWAKQLEFPFYRLSDYVARDRNGQLAVLQPGVREALVAMGASGLDLGALTIGGLLTTPLYMQPAVVLLSHFGLYDLFNLSIQVGVYTDDKKNLIQPSGRTLFIDDDFRWLMGVKSLGTIHVLDRHKFENWSALFFDERLKNEIQV